MVERKDVLRPIYETRDKLLSGEPVLSSGFLLSGLPLIGKTFLTKTVHKNCSNYGIPSTIIDFNNSPSFVGEYGKVLLMANIMEGLVISADAPAGKPVYNNPERWGLDAATNALVEYMEWLRGFLRKPLNVNFERIDRAPVETWEWFQKTVLGPAILGSNNLSIMTSRVGYRNLPALDWDVLRRIDTVSLKPLTEAESLSLVDDLTLEERKFNNVISITGGIAGLIELLVGHSQIVKTAKDASKTVLDRIESLNPEARFLLPTISLLHLVDVEILMVMANATALPNAGRQIVRKRILSNLVDTGLLNENSGYGHSLEKGLDTILQTSWQEGHTTDEAKALEAAVVLLKKRKKEGWDNMEIEIKKAENSL